MAELMTAFDKFVALSYPQDAAGDALRRALGSRSDDAPALVGAAAGFLARRLSHTERELDEGFVSLLADDATPAARACQIIAQRFLPALRDPLDLSAAAAAGLPSALVAALARMHALAAAGEAPRRAAGADEDAARFAARAGPAAEQLGTLLLLLLAGGAPGWERLPQWDVRAQHAEPEGAWRQAAATAAGQLAQDGSVARLVALAVEGLRPHGPGVAMAVEVIAVSALLAALRFGMCAKLSVHLRRARPLDSIEHALDAALAIAPRAAGTDRAQARSPPTLVGLVGLFKVALQAAAAAAQRVPPDRALLGAVEELGLPAKLALALRALAAQAAPLAPAPGDANTCAQTPPGDAGDGGCEATQGPGWAEAVAWARAAGVEAEAQSAAAVRLAEGAFEGAWGAAARFKARRLAWELRGAGGAEYDAAALAALLREHGWDVRAADRAARRRAGAAGAGGDGARVARFLETMLPGRAAEAGALAAEALALFGGDERRALAYAAALPQRQTIAVLLDVAKVRAAPCARPRAPCSVTRGAGDGRNCASWASRASRRGGGAQRTRGT